MIIKSIAQHPDLRIAHENELVAVQRQLALMKEQIELLTTRLMMNESTNAESRINERIKILSERGNEFVALDQIMYCEAKGNYCKIYAEDSNDKKNVKCYMVSKTLKIFSEQLPASYFVRCHNSYLINKNHVVRSFSKEGLWLTMRNNQNIPVSRRRRHMLTTIFS